jgi:hypothetical protein
MEELYQELIKIKDKYMELCNGSPSCDNCPLNKIIFSHDYGEERICDTLDRF